MANHTVALLLRVKIEGRYPYLQPAASSNGRFRAGWAIYKGQPIRFSDGVYALRYKQGKKLLYENVGNQLDAALIAQRRRKALLEVANVGLAPRPPEPERPKPETLRLTLSEARDKYVNDIAARKSWRTASHYSFNINLFMAVCPDVVYLDQIERKHVVNFVLHLRDKRKNGLRTQYNKVAELDTFLRFHKSQLPMLKDHWPRFTEKAVFAYSEKEISTLLEAAGPDDRLAYQFFLGSGGREQEVQFACWPEINFDNRTFTVKAKPDLGFTPKDYEERTIPLPDSLIDELRSHLDSNPDERLIFTTDLGTPEGHFLRRLKKTALKAGLNCGHCVNKQGLSCSEHPVCGHWHLHALRKTFATMHHENGVSARTLQEWLGHSDLETTLCYLQAASYASERTRQAVNKTFDKLFRAKPKLVA